jgi:hypothetical protein
MTYIHCRIICEKYLLSTTVFQSHRFSKLSKLPSWDFRFLPPEWFPLTTKCMWQWCKQWVLMLMILFWTNILSTYLLRIIKGSSQPSSELWHPLRLARSLYQERRWKAGISHLCKRQSPCFVMEKKVGSCMQQDAEVASVVWENTLRMRSSKRVLHIGIWGYRSKNSVKKVVQKCMWKKRRGNHCNILQCKWETESPQRLHVDHHLSIH